MDERARIKWTDEMKAAVTEFRSRGMNVEVISEKIGVNKDTFLRFRRRTGFPIAPILRSNRKLVGRHVG